MFSGVLTRSVVLCALALGACNVPEDPAGRVVAVLDGERLTVAGLRAYFDLNLLEDPDEETTAAERNRVLSRLFDNFVDERLLLAEARRAGVELSDAELESYLRMERGEGGAANGGTEAKVVRGTLVVQKFRESYLRRKVRVTPDAVEAHIADNRDRLLPEHQVILRSLLMQSAEEAAQVHREIAGNRRTFADAVATYGKQPGQGVALEISLDSLPPGVREAVGRLEPGGVSEPIELHGSVYLFQLESRQTERTVDEEELRERARDELLRERRRRALDVLLRRLREQSGLEIRWRNLPFRYVEEGGAG